jgi:small subunit ribosomal protein S14
MSNLIQRDKKKRNLYLKQEIKRLEYKSLFNDLTLEKEFRYNNMLALNKIPRNSCRVRIKNRCILTGRTHSVYKICKLSRIKFRELASQGLLMGITKSSW